jgi:hypothetical protein
MSGLIALLTTMLGALRAALMAARLAPAVAMQPPAPPMFRRGLARPADVGDADAPDHDHDPAQRHPLAGAQLPDRRGAGRGHLGDHRGGLHGLLAEPHHRPGLQPVLPAGRHDPVCAGRAALRPARGRAPARRDPGRAAAVPLRHAPQRPAGKTRRAGGAARRRHAEPGDRAGRHGDHRAAGGHPAVRRGWPSISNSTWATRSRWPS